MTHPYDALALIPGKKIMVGVLEVTVKTIFPKGSLGYQHGWVQVTLPADGLIGERTLTLTAKELGYVG